MPGSSPHPQQPNSVKSDPRAAQERTKTQEHKNISLGCTAKKSVKPHVREKNPALRSHPRSVLLLLACFSVERVETVELHQCASSSVPPRTLSTTAVPTGVDKPPRHMSPLWTKHHDLSFLGRHLCRMSLSEVAGHASFMFLGLGFLETDLLPLRVYAAAGVSCSIAFQYFRPEPLWIPISWNTVFLGINAGMVGLLLKEENDARQQDKDAATLYDQTFRESGLTAVDFMKIKAISTASKRAPGAPAVASPDPIAPTTAAIRFQHAGRSQGVKPSSVTV